MKRYLPIFVLLLVFSMLLFTSCKKKQNSPTGENLTQTQDQTSTELDTATGDEKNPATDPAIPGTTDADDPDDDPPPITTVQPTLPPMPTIPGGGNETSIIPR